jgi:hypothetical protein
MLFKSINTNKLPFGKNKGKLIVHIRILMTEEEFNEIFDKHYKQIITNKKGFRCCSDKTIEILDGVIKIGKESSTNKNEEMQQ